MQQRNDRQKELNTNREFAYRAPSPDSEPPTWQDEPESEESEGEAESGASGLLPQEARGKNGHEPHEPAVKP